MPEVGRCKERRWTEVGRSFTELYHPQSFKKIWEVENLIPCSVHAAYLRLSWSSSGTLQKAEICLLLTASLTQAEVLYTSLCITAIYRSLHLPANPPALFTTLQNSVLGKPTALRTGSSAAGLECVQKPLKRRDIPWDRVNLQKENMLCNQPLTKRPKPHTWTLIHRRKLQISITQVQPCVSDLAHLSVLPDKGMKPPQCNQLPTLLKELDRKDFKLKDF